MSMQDTGMRGSPDPPRERVFARWLAIPAIFALGSLIVWVAYRLALR